MRPTLLLAALLLVLLHRPAAADEISLAGDFGEPRVIVPAPRDATHAHLSWPKVVRAADGTLVVAYVAGRFHGTDGGGCPAVSISTDDGKSFTPPQILKTYAPGQKYTSAGNLALGVAPDGAIVLLSMAYAAKNNTIDGWRSTDSGRTWRPVDVSKLDQNQTGSVFGLVSSVPDKGLAVFGHYRAGSPRTQGLWMSWSTDQGAKWGAPQLVTNTALVEPAFVFSQGRFVGLVRTAATDPFYVQLVSDDYGQSWQEKSPGLRTDRPGEVQLPSPCLVADPAQPGRLCALVSERYHGKLAQDLYGRIVLWTADAKTLDWRPRGEVARFPRALGVRTDLTYAWMAPLGGHRWYIVFYCGEFKGPNEIYGLTATLPSGK